MSHKNDENIVVQSEITGYNESSSSATGLDDPNDEDQAQGSTFSSSDPLLGRRRGLQTPEFLSRISVDERKELEAKLKRKIDARLMPALIVMYILNYIDRWVYVLIS